jgi:hypothetical protein
VNTVNSIYFPRGAHKVSQTPRETLKVRPTAPVDRGNRQIAHGIDRVLRPIDLP